MNKPSKAQVSLSVTLLTFAIFAPRVLAQNWNHGVNERQERQQQRILNGVNSGQLTGHEAHHLEREQSALNEQEARMRASGGGLSPEERSRLEREQNGLSRDIRQQTHDNQTQFNQGGAGWQQNHGMNGYPGQPGYVAQPGFNGAHGQPGYIGQPGYAGNPGFVGQPGFNGAHGQPGFAGNPGFNGAGNPNFNNQGINGRQESQQERIQQGLQSGQLTKHEYKRLEEKQARFAQLEAQLRASGGGLSPNERAQLEFEQRQLSQDIERQKHDGQVR